MFRLNKAFTILIWFLVSSCSAEELERSESEVLVNSSEFTITENWSDYTAADWREKLNLSDQCVGLNEEEERRLINKIPLDNGNDLLVLTCDLGAYQDSHYIYRVNLIEKTIKSIVLEVPEYTDEWIFHTTGLIWGSIYLNKNTKQLEVINLSAATGMCGYAAYYNTKNIQASSQLKLLRAAGDSDCYNGVTVESWPIIKSVN